jgi:hypothetical protein
MKALSMDYKQRTIEEIVGSERDMVLTGPVRYGAYYQHALSASLFLTHFIKSMDQSRWIFGGFVSLVKKHHTLALFSTLRLHQVQSMMNLRQVLEAGACAAFAIANPEHSHFVDTDHDGLLDASQKLARKRYDWLDRNYADGSKFITDIKKLVNTSAAHANLIYTSNTFRMNEENRIFEAPFFDIADDHYVKTELWQLGNVAIGLLELLYGVNQGRDVVKFVDDFVPRLQQLMEENNALRAEMTSTDRFKRVAEKVRTNHDPKNKHIGWKLLNSDCG